jgi:hypothetical protein
LVYLDVPPGDIEALSYAAPRVLPSHDVFLAVTGFLYDAWRGAWEAAGILQPDPESAGREKDADA